MIRVTVYAGSSLQDERKATVNTYHEDARSISERLRQVGLEYKTADYFGDRQVVITLDPIPDGKDELLDAMKEIHLFAQEALNAQG